MAHHRSGYLAAQALALVMALTGNVDIPGGLMLRGRDPLDRPAKRLAADLGEQAYRHKDVYGAYPEAGQGVVQRIPKDILEGVSIPLRRFLPCTPILCSRLRKARSGGRR